MSDDWSQGRQAAPATGDEDLDAVLAELEGLDDEPLDRHIEVGEAVHRALQGRLGDLGGA
ncbi:MAG: hypothetical protein ACTHJJ_05395 [Intrasporangium sp.]|uniref:hypothetical protein n=1 Tax=Intrasporangium sp. TaxID=1925024 RepID=UPI003F7FF2CC